MKEMEKETYGDGGGWSRQVETTKISVRPPLESFILIKIRPKGRRDNTHSSSHNICAA